MDAPSLCDECGAPWMTADIRCTRCGALRTEVTTAPTLVEGPAAERAWRTIVGATVVFAAVQQATQWLAVAHGGATAWAVSRALLILAATAWAWRRLSRRDATALVVWSWVMAASVVVMALTFAATERWAPLRGFDRWLTAWAWATVVAYAVGLWRWRRVVLAEAVG
jgi:hypothetical protein